MITRGKLSQVPAAAAPSNYDLVAKSLVVLFLILSGAFAASVSVLNALYWSRHGYNTCDDMRNRRTEHDGR